MIKIILAFSALILVVAGLFVYQKATTPAVTIKGHDFQLIIAKTEEEKQIGLSKHEKPDEDKAMLFIFEKKDYYRFWMKDMKFPLDIIFISDDRISKIVEDAKPPKSGTELTIYPASEPVNKVLEINSGLSKKYNFKAGDKVEIKNVK